MELQRGYLSHKYYHFLCCGLSPFLSFHYIYLVSTDTMPSVTWPCLPTYSSYFIFTTTNGPKFRLSRLKYFQIQENAMFFYLKTLTCSVSSVSETILHHFSCDSCVISSTALPQEVLLEQHTPRCLSQTLPWDPNILLHSTHHSTYIDTAMFFFLICQHPPLD